jgi:hypothetical protein
MKNVIPSGKKSSSAPAESPSADEIERAGTVIATLDGFSKASGSTKLRVGKIIRLGERTTKRALSARSRRELAERLDNAT